MLENRDDVERQRGEEGEQRGRSRPRDSLRQRRVGGRGGSGGTGPCHRGTAEPDAQQKHEQHQGERVRRAADHQHQHPGPSDLVEQRGERRRRQEHHGRAPDRGAARRRGRRWGGRDRTGLERGGQHEGGDAQGEIHRRRPPKGEADPDALDEHEPGERGTRHGAQRVEAVQAAEGAPQPLALGAHECAGEDRESAAHQRRGNEQHERGEAEAQGQARRATEAEAACHGDVHLMRERQHERRQQAEHADGDLEAAVQGGGVRMAVRAAPEPPRAETQAPHVGGDHGRHGLDG